MIYKLMHVYKKYRYMDARPEVKNLGTFTTPEETRAAIEKYKTLPGFRDHQHCFYIKPIDLEITGDAVFYVEIYQYDEPRYCFEFQDLVTATFDEQKAKDVLKVLEKQNRSFYQTDTTTECWITKEVLNEISAFWGEGFD